MSDMKKLSLHGGGRLQGPSLPEIVTEWEDLARDLQRAADLKLHGRKAMAGPMLSAVLLDWMRRLPADRQAEGVAWGLRELEKLMDVPATGKKKPPGGNPGGPLDVKARHYRNKGDSGDKSVKRKKLD